MARAGRVSGGICVRGRRARWLSLKRFWWRPARKIYDLFPKRGRIVKTLYYGITVTIRNASATTYSRQHRERFAHQVLPNYDTKLATACNGEKSSNLTFSKPKNLSLPSILMGPASARSLSRGVSWGAFGSFLVGVLPAEVSAGFCVQGQRQRQRGPLLLRSNSGAILTVVPLRRPRNDAMVSERVRTAGPDSQDAGRERAL